MRRSRSKARKPRYVSLRRHLAPPPPPPSPLTLPEPTDMSSSAAAPEDERIGDRHQLDLFSLHSDHIDRDTPVVCLLDDRGRGTNPTLAALLGSGAASASSPSLDSQSMNWEDDGGGDADGLARRALRGRERWAYCRPSSSDEEVASTVAVTVAVAGGVDLWKGATETRFLALKLDYEEILAAWSDRGPLFTDGDGPQVVPDLHHKICTPFHSSVFPVLMEVSQGGGASPWKVPEAERDENGSEELVKKEVISREARVNRYKEKRGNRLFAKRIRYEVRKMNAENRPRIKGRFVKRKDVNEDHS